MAVPGSIEPDHQGAPGPAYGGVVTGGVVTGGVVAGGVVADGAAPDQDRPAWADRRGPERPQVSVVVPTYNEAANIVLLLDRIELALAHLDYEVVVVDDDSPDGTWAVARDHAATTRRVQVLRRVGRRGLSSAVIEGMALARGRCLAVIDADLQHDEAILPAMVSNVLDHGADICIGSRAAEGGSYGQFGPGRRLLSWTGARVAGALLHLGLSDPMSGFFVVSRAYYEEVRPALTGRGFKLLLELLAHGPPARVAEVGYHFRLRNAGDTKLGAGVAVAFLASMANLFVARHARAQLPTYAVIALFAAALRTSVGSVLADVGSMLPAPLAHSSWLLTLAAFEVSVLVEFGLQNRFAFPTAGHPPGRRLGPLLRFHLVAGHGVLTLGGVAAVVEARFPPDPSGAVTALWHSFVLATGGIVAVIVASYILNQAVTWPRAGLRADDPHPRGHSDRAPVGSRA